MEKAGHTCNCQAATTPAAVVTVEVDEALKIADLFAEAVKELDFGNVFWAVGILAKYIQAARRGGVR